MNWLSNLVRPKIRAFVGKPEVPENLWTKCPECGTMLFHRELKDNLNVCTSCDHHMPITPRARFGALFDGGVFVEVLRDVALKLCPFGEEEALAMIRGLRGFPLLDGARGRPKADVRALAAALARLSVFGAEAGPRLQSVDVNPIMVLPEDKGAVALDAVIELAD